MLKLHRILLRTISFAVVCITVAAGSVRAQQERLSWPSPFPNHETPTTTQSTTLAADSGSHESLPPSAPVPLPLPPGSLRNTAEQTTGAANPMLGNSLIGLVPPRGKTGFLLPQTSGRQLPMSGTETSLMDSGATQSLEPTAGNFSLASTNINGAALVDRSAHLLPENAATIAPFAMQTGPQVASGPIYNPEVQLLGPEGYYPNHVRPVPFQPEAFLPTPTPQTPSNPYDDLLTYRGKQAVPVQRPWVEFWRPFYPAGTPPPARTPFGPTNLLLPHFYVYGDYRTGVGANRNQAGRADSWAHRLNLDMDLQLTATERIHGFMGPLDNGKQFTRLDFTNDTSFQFEGDARFDTLFFEGDLGSIAGGCRKTASPFDLPFTFGLVPLLYQNGIWMQDAMLGAAVALPAKHSRTLRWSNFDATFFAAVDQITTDAFRGSNSAAEMIGTAWFIEAYEGYFEVDYAYLHDDVGQNRSYNNFSASYTRRYFSRISNSVRVITNFGQDLPVDKRTADGYLLLLENSLVSFLPTRFVPYCNLFYGSGRPQSAARAAGAGGVLVNTGINFESDGLTGYPTLDPTGHNTYGGALGMNLLGAGFNDQIVLEMAALGSYGSAPFRQVSDSQYGLGARYQRALSNAWLVRFDTMYGWLGDAHDIQGARAELRWKF